VREGILEGWKIPSPFLEVDYGFPPLILLGTVSGNIVLYYFL
jgi:hypothetical protein